MWYHFKKFSKKKSLIYSGNCYLVKVLHRKGQPQAIHTFSRLSQWFLSYIGELLFFSSKLICFMKQTTSWSYKKLNDIALGFCQRTQEYLKMWRHGKCPHPKALKRYKKLSIMRQSNCILCWGIVLTEMLKLHGSLPVMGKCALPELKACSGNFQHKAYYWILDYLPAVYMGSSAPGPFGLG